MIGEHIREYMVRVAIIILGGIMITMLVCTMIEAIRLPYLHDDACENIGFEKYRNINQFKFCERDGNMQQILIDCKYSVFFRTKCTATPINVGGIQVTIG